MSKFKRGLMYSAEEFEENAQTDTVVGNTDIVELDNHATEISDMGNGINKAIDASHELMEIGETISDDMTPAATAIVTIATESVYNRVGINKRVVVSMEENKSMVSKIWEAIKKAFSVMVEKIKAFFNWIFGRNKQAAEQEKKVQAEVKTLKEPPKEQVAKIVEKNPDFIEASGGLQLKAKANWINALSYQDSLDPDEIATGLSGFNKLFQGIFNATKNYNDTNKLIKGDLTAQDVKDSIIGEIFGANTSVEVCGFSLVCDPKGDTLAKSISIKLNKNEKIKTDSAIDCPSPDQIQKLVINGGLITAGIDKMEKAQLVHRLETLKKDLEAANQNFVQNTDEQLKDIQNKIKDLTHFLGILGGFLSHAEKVRTTLFESYYKTAKKPFVI